MSEINDKYTSLGGAGGVLGAPTGGEVAAANCGRKQEFQRGAIYWSAPTGAQEVHGEIRWLWASLGGEAGWLGYPRTDETAARDNAGRFNDFQGGSVFWHPDTGAKAVAGAIRQRWVELGDVTSVLGYPLTSETTTPDGVGRFNHFQHGSIYWTPGTGAHELLGPIRERWARLGWERGHLGYPVAAPVTEVRDRVTYQVAIFQHGTIELNTQTQYVWVDKRPSPGAPNYRVPLVAYRVSDDDGGRPCAITVDGVGMWVGEANRIYAAAGVNFEFDGVLRDLKDTQVNNLVNDGDPHWKAIRDRLNSLAAERRSVVVVFRFGPGQSSIGGGFSWWTYDFVAMSFFDANALSVLPHELGHHFGLPHTFGRTFQTAREAADHVLGNERVTDLDGDREYVDDTPPDPFILELQNTTSVTAVQLAGTSFALQRANLMSYWNHGGTAELSRGQIERVRKLVVERQARYLDVTDVLGIDSGPINARISAARTRLAALLSERTSEENPAHRRRLALMVLALQRHLGLLTAQAKAQGCL